MKPKYHFYLFRLYSLPKQSWNLFCGANYQPYADWHAPIGYMFFARVYTFLIFLFAFFFSVTGEWKISGDKEILDGFDALYFSIVTITTLGYGDIVPITSIQKFLVGLEAISGIVVFGAMLVRLGQSISDKQHEAFQAAEQKRRERPLLTTFHSMAQALTDFLEYYDAKHPKNSSATDFEIYLYGTNSVFTKPTIFSTELFVSTTLEVGKTQMRIKPEYWTRGLDICFKLVKRAILDAQSPIDDERLIKLIDDFYTNAELTRKRITDFGPIPVDIDRLRTFCEEFENLIGCVDFLRNAIFEKASARQNYQSMKYVGGIIEEERKKALRNKRVIAPYLLGYRLGKWYRSLQ